MRRGFARLSQCALIFLLILLAAPLRAQEVAAVRVAGEPVFSVAALPNLGAAARASAISDSLSARLKSDAPVAPIQVVATDSAALLVIGSDTLMHVTPGDAEVASAHPLSPEQARQMTVSVAKDWSRALGSVLARAVEEETAPVVVQGRSIFKVSGTPELRAKRRAAAVGLRIAQLAAARGPLPPLRLKGERTVSILAGRDTILTVTPAEAELFDTTPQELAR
ncbi:MAG TPA: hypothetical protein VFI96_05880, partial [Longimicrobiaceae bacterium]|nr:hypothetical protein [Longimicrobiaceae bacterium]